MIIYMADTDIVGVTDCCDVTLQNICEVLRLVRC